MRTLNFVILPVTASLLLALAGCGGNVSASSGGGGSGGATGGAGGGAGGATGGAGAGGGTGGVTDPCENYVGQATADEIALSPFPDAESEVLAIEASGKVVAPKDVYERVHADLTSIRAANAPVAGLFAMSAWSADKLLVSFEPTGLEELGMNAYHFWDCANILYGATNIQVLGAGGALVTFGHLFDIQKLASEYSKYLYVLGADPSYGAGDGDDVCAVIGADGVSYTYVFDHGAGDCPAGCTEHTYYGFQTSGSTITPLGTFTNNDPAPAWFTPACSQWL